MHIKFFFLTNAILTFATDIPWASNHRYHVGDRQLLPNSKHDTRSIGKKNNEQLRIQKTKREKFVMNKHVKTQKEDIDPWNNEHLRIQKNEKDKSIMSLRAETQKEKNIKPFNLSEDTDRIQFQIEGHEGPQTYIFGFDTGYGKNRQYRLEERHRDGTIKGQYGYYDAKGKLRRVQYVASPFDGYTEIHHESNIKNINK
ncbi:unnamed protein product [Xylocopa violacea]|uniref:Uncharacterized protein n=1 Tax=Xylocopa violacea TaxID=135666 RepID=A0ABP1PC92_XYLVO